MTTTNTPPGRLYFGNAGAHTVTVEEKDGSVRRLEHHVHHSPDGFSWGYQGSGPSELARCILWDFLGAQPHPACYQDMKEDLVSTQPIDGPFELDGERLDGWLMSWRAQYPNTPTVESDDHGCGSPDDPRWDEANRG